MASARAWDSLLFPDGHPARERLAIVVRDLTRARRDQLLLEHFLTGVFFGLVAGCAGVALVRLVPLSLSPWNGVAAVLAVALIAGVVVAWRRRPGELEVAIRADLALDLEQRLSTAWELELRGADEGLLERLAAQVERSRRIPMRAALVFPLRANLWGKLIPVAAVLLVLLGALDMPKENEAPAAEPDPLVTSEGERLREYGLAMGVRAEREGLPRSAEESQSVKRLGSRMESGAVTRGEALVRLRELGATLRSERRLAAAEGGVTPVEPGALDAIAESRSLPSSDLQRLLDGLRDGSIDALDIQALAEGAMARSDLVIDPAELQAALERFAKGDERELRDVLERLVRIERAVREVEELELAEEQIDLARESLGDIDRFAERAIARIAGSQLTDADYDTVLLDPRRDRSHRDEGPGGAIRAPGRGFDSPTDSANRPGAKDIEESPDVVVTARGQSREGRVYAFEGRVLPRATRPSLDEVALDPRFSAQVEEVLSKEEVPLHEKEFIRRYFLTLSDEADAEPGGAP